MHESSDQFTDRPCEMWTMQYKNNPDMSQMGCDLHGHLFDTTTAIAKVLRNKDCAKCRVELGIPVNELLKIATGALQS